MITITDYYIIGRWLWLTGFFLTSLAILVWMSQNRGKAMLGAALLLCSLHATLYYVFYLLYWYHPALEFNLQSFANWGSLVFGQIAWTGALIGLDLVTGWFTRYVLTWFLSNHKHVKSILWI